jgi:hypothetical protein
MSHQLIFFQTLCFIRFDFVKVNGRISTLALIFKFDFKSQVKKMAANDNTTSAALSALKAACSRKKFGALKNFLNFKNFMSFKDLLPGEYIVDKFSIVNTKYGERVRIDLHDSYMFLPKSFLKTVTPEVIDDLNSAPKMMIYQGKDAENGNALILDFNEVSYFDSELLGLLTPNYNS